MVIYYIVLAKIFEKWGCIRVYMQIKPHENFEKQGGVYVYTCIHPNKIEIESSELVYYGNI